MKIKTLELFSGIGAPMKSLKNNYEVENVGTSEWNIWSSIAYASIHHFEEFQAELEALENTTKEQANSYLKKHLSNSEGKPVFSRNGKSPMAKYNLKRDEAVKLLASIKVSKNFGDIQNLNANEMDVDLLVHGSPCQAFSKAGKGEGGAKGSGTSSSLLWESVRIIGECKPKFIVWENVRNALSKVEKKDGSPSNYEVVMQYIEELNEMGYKSSYKVLNAKDFTIPQNRERVFIVSHLDEEVDFSFENIIRNELDKLSNYIDFDSCDKLLTSVKQATKKGYIEATTPYIVDLAYPNSKTRRGRVQEDGKCWTTLTTQPNIAVVTKIAKDFDYARSKDRKLLDSLEKFFNTNSKTTKIGYFGCTEEDKDVFNKRLYSVNDGEAIPTIAASDNPFFAIESNFLSDNDKARIKNWKAQEKPFEKIICESSNHIPTITTRGNGLDTSSMKLISHDGDVESHIKVRKILPHECFRLMGFEDEDYIKASMFLPTQELYKVTGNSIVVNVLDAIFEELFKEKNMLVFKIKNNGLKSSATIEGAELKGIGKNGENTFETIKPNVEKLFDFQKVPSEEIMEFHKVMNDTIAEVILKEDNAIINYVDAMFEERFKLAKTRPEDVVYLCHVNSFEIKPKEEGDDEIYGFAYDSGYDAWISFSKRVYNDMKQFAISNDEEAANEYGKTLHMFIMKRYLYNAKKKVII